MSGNLKSNSPCYVYSYPADGATPSNGDGIIFDSATKRWKTANIGAFIPHNLLDGNVDQDTVAVSPVAGDLIYGNATPLWDRLPKGAQGSILKMGASLPAWLVLGTPLQQLRVNAGGTDLEYFTPGALTTTRQRILLAADQTTSSNTFVDCPNMTITLPTRTGGMANITFFILWNSAGVPGSPRFRLVDSVDGNISPFGMVTPGGGSTVYSISAPIVAPLDGRTIKLQMLETGSQVLTVYGSPGSNVQSCITSMEIS